jgi:hypothetical protein
MTDCMRAIIEPSSDDTLQKRNARLARALLAVDQWRTA